MNQKRNKKQVLSLLWRRVRTCLALAVSTFLLTRLASAFPNATEQLYARGLYPVIASVLSWISQWVPFSLDDLLYVLLIVVGLVSLMGMLFRRVKWYSVVALWVNTLAAMYMLFYWLWGFNYFRPEMNERLQVQESVPDRTAFLTVMEQLVEGTNSSHIAFNTLSIQQVDSLVESSYALLAPLLRLNYPAGVRAPKPITFSHFFAQATISGYYGPFFSEVHLNDYLLPVEYPMVLAHEKAHQLGITSEAEANFYAWLVCAQSGDRYLQYSANLYVLRYFVYEGYQLEGADTILKRINPEVRGDFKRIREHWLSLRDEKIDHYASKVNDAYLKTNQVEKGIEDYTGVVKLVMDFSMDEEANKRMENLLTN